MIYEFRPRDKYTGALLEDLTPIFSRFFEISTGDTLPLPTITETQGIYHFEFDAETEVDVEIDLGETANVAMRYLDFVLSPLDNIVPVTQAQLEQVKEDIINQIGGTGDIPVDHNFGGVDSFRYTTAEGAGIGGANITIYLQSDYLAGRKTQEFILGKTTTKADGRWKTPIKVEENMEYIVEFYKPGQYQISTVAFTTIT